MTRKTAIQLIIGSMVYASLKAQDDQRKYQMPPEKRAPTLTMPEEHTVNLGGLKRLNVVIGAKTFTFTMEELAKALES